MNRNLRKSALLAAPALVLLLLAACHGQKAKSDDQRTAAGQVLSGSISDAMLPYEATSSTPPLAQRKAADTGAVTDEAASGAESGDATPAAAEPAPSIAN